MGNNSTYFASEAVKRFCQDVRKEDLTALPKKPIFPESCEFKKERRLAFSDIPIFEKEAQSKINDILKNNLYIKRIKSFIDRDNSKTDI